VAAPTFFTWDGDPGESIAPRRPSTDDLGGRDKTDDQSFPPNDLQMPSAAGHVQKTDVLAAAAKMAPAAVISVEIQAGVPVVVKMKTFGTLLVIGDLTVTDNGLGDTSIEWPVDSFPVTNVEPSQVVIHSVLSVWGPAAARIPNGVRIRTFVSAAPADVNFTVTVEGQ
jgi:hypothetical protein